MKCPKCESRINKELTFCSKCGFNLKELTNASNFKAKKVLKNGSILEKEKVLYTFNTPKDLVKKELVLLTLFLGLFAGHDFYVGKFWLGISKVVSLAIGISLSILILTYNLTQISTISGLFCAYPLIMWVYDIFRVIFKRYPIPVMLED